MFTIFSTAGAPSPAFSLANALSLTSCSRAEFGLVVSTSSPLLSGLGLGVAGETGWLGIAWETGFSISWSLSIADSSCTSCRKIVLINFIQINLF